MRWLLAPFLALSCLIGVKMPARGANPEVWFNPHPLQDMLDLWTDDAPWQHAASRVGVLEIEHWWIDGATDAQILAMADFAKRHHMKIDFDIEAIGRLASDTCGYVEGYTGVGGLTPEAATLKRLNIQVDMMTMDEPAWFGHYDPDPNACHFSVPDLVARIAANLNGVIALYPGIQLYDIEPVPAVTNFPDWRDTLSSLRAGLTQAIGKQIRGVQLDVDWSTPAWMPAIQDMRTFLHQQSIELGIFEYGGFALSNADWINTAVQHFEYMEGTLGIIPDEIVFTSWSPFPQFVMPETSPTTLSWLIDRYFRERTLLDVQFTGLGAHGKLTTEKGKPIAGATINGYIPGVDFSQPLPVFVIQTVVPSNAVSAVLGIRLSAECNCQGFNDVLVGPLQYQETQGGSSSYNYMIPPVPSTIAGIVVDGETVGGTKVTRLIATPTQSLYANSPWFPVTPGAQFTYTIPASTIGGSGWYGNIIIVWGDANNNGLSRISWTPSSGRRLMSTATTAADGTFELPTLPRVGPAVPPVSVEFPGDATRRSAGWMPLQ